MGGNQKICVVGSANVDLTFRTSRLPLVGETLFGESFFLSFGGKGANQTVMAAKLGASVTLVARVGNDTFGRQSIHHLQAQGLDTARVRLDDARATGVAGIIVDEQARNCILVVPGANLGLSIEDVRAAASAIQAAAIVICQLEVPLETSLEAFRLAKKAGARTILNPAPAVPLPRELFQLADFCIPNQAEIETITGMPATTIEETATAARALQNRGARTILVTLGDRGVLLVDNEEVTHIPATPVLAVDPTGAGDAFIGSLAVFLSEGHAIRDAAQKSNAIAALTVTRMGTHAAFPPRPVAESFLASLD